MIYPLVNEFIARSVLGSPMDGAEPIFVQSMGYAPMKSGPFIDVSPTTLD